MGKKAKTELLEMSREVPCRQGSPYGALTTDVHEIKRIARRGYERIRALEALLVKDLLSED